mgnify:CR=1 FL=1
MPQPCPPTLCDFAYAAGERLRDLGTNLVSAVEAETLAPQIAHDIALRAQAIALRLALRAAAATMPEWPADRPLAFDHPALDAALLERQREFSLRTFGPGARAAGVVAHIRKELLEVEAAPADLSEWVDVMILAVDGAMRAGHAPAEVLTGYRAKLERNFARTWPDWRTMPADGPIEHVRAADPALAPKPPQVGDEVDADEVPPGSVAQPIDPPAAVR